MKVVDGKPLLTAYCKRCIGARSISNEQINALVEVALYGGDYSRVKEKYFSDDS